MGFLDKKKEGFSQNENYVLKINNEIYDEFYAKQYDSIKPSNNELTFVLQSTMPTDDSVFLDIGSGTGYILNELNELGYDAYGIDKSKAMVEYTEKKYPETIIKCGDVLNPILYEKGVFSHILCFGSTIYEIENKKQFIQNCFFWLKPGGCLALDVYDEEPFTKKTDTNKSSLFGFSGFYTENKTNDTILFLNDYKYTSQFFYDKDKNNKKGYKKEKFIDNISGNIRENEQTVYIEKGKDILSFASYNGFIIQSKYNLDKTNNHSLYILERML